MNNQCFLVSREVDGGSFESKDWPAKGDRPGRTTYSQKVAMRLSTFEIVTIEIPLEKPEHFLSEEGEYDLDLTCLNYAKTGYGTSLDFNKYGLKLIKRGKK